MAVTRAGGSPSRAGRLFGCAGLIAGALLGGCVYEPEPFPPRPQGPTAAPAPPLGRLQAMLEAYSAEMLRKGASAVLIEAKVGPEKWSHAAGVRSRERGLPVQLSDPVQAGGITQTLVAVSVLKLVDSGRLGLEDPVTRYLPELEDLLRPPGPLPVRLLLGHTSGLPDFQAPLLKSAPARQVLATPVSPEQRLALAGAVPWPVPHPRESRHSRSDYEALGLLVERLRGEPFAGVLHADIVAPLGLRSTTMLGAGPAPADLVHGYALVDGGLVDVATSALQSGSASAGVLSSVKDLNNFYAALLRGRLSAESLVEMKGSTSTGYGLGLDQWYDRCTNGSYYGHAGDVPGYGTVAISSADGNRQLAMAVAYPPPPLSPKPDARAMELTVLAQAALNASCRVQFEWTPSQ